VGAYRDGILDRSFFVISPPKAKMIQPKTCDVSAAQFSNPQQYEGQTVSVSGKITLYHASRRSLSSKSSAWALSLLLFLAEFLETRVVS